MQEIQQQGVKRILLVFAVKNPSPLHPSYPLNSYFLYNNNNNIIIIIFIVKQGVRGVKG